MSDFHVMFLREQLKENWLAKLDQRTRRESVEECLKKRNKYFLKRSMLEQAILFPLFWTVHSNRPTDNIRLSRVTMNSNGLDSWSITKTYSLSHNNDKF